MTSGTNVGSIYTEYKLDLNPLRRAVQEAKQITRQLEADAGAFAARAKPVKLFDGAGAAADARAIKQARNEADQALRSAERLERTFRQQTDAEIAAARAMGDYAKALSLVDRELNAANTDLIRHNQLLARQAQIQRQQANAQRPAAAPSGLGGLISGAVAPLATVAAATALVDRGFSAANDARAAQQTANALRLAAGEQRRYNDAVAIALRNQRLFGGTLQENQAALIGLANISRQTGISLAEIDTVVNQLKAADPAATFEDAQVALREFASGDITSLAERFELPRAKLTELRNEAGGDSAVALRGLAELLTKSGYAADTAAKAVPATTIALNEMNQKLERSELAVGNTISKLQGLAAEALTTGVTIGGVGFNLGNFTTGLETSARSTAAYVEAITAGKTQAEAFAAAAAAVVAPITEQSTAADTSAAAYRSYSTAAQEAEKRQYDLNTAIRASQKELRDQVLATSDSARESERLRDVQQTIASQGADVASGATTIEQAMLRLQQQYGFTADEARRLIAEQERIAGRAAANAAGEQLGQAFEDLGTGKLGRAFGQVAGNVLGGQFGGAIADVATDAARAKKEQDAIQEALRNQQLAFENTAQSVARLKGELAGLTPSTVAYINKATELGKAQERLASEQDKRGTKGLSAAQRVARQESTLLDQRTNRQEDYFVKLLQLQEDYQRRAARSQEDFDLSRTRDTEDFERERNRLLAEGKRKEAELLTQEFQREQKRNQEDFDRERARGGEDFANQNRRQAADVGLDVERLDTRAAIRGVRVGPAAQVAADAGLRGVNVPTGAPAGQITGAPGALASPIQVTIPIAPVAINLDGERVAVITWPHLEVLIAEDLTATALSSPVQTPSVTAVGGLRP